MSRPRVEDGPTFYNRAWDGLVFCPRLPLRVTDPDGTSYWLVGPSGERWTDEQVNADIERQLREFLRAKEDEG